MSKPTRIYIVMGKQEGYVAEPVRAFLHKTDAIRFAKSCERCETLMDNYDTVWVSETIYHD